MKIYDDVPKDATVGTWEYTVELHGHEEPRDRRAAMTRALHALRDAGCDLLGPLTCEARHLGTQSALVVSVPAYSTRPTARVLEAHDAYRQFQTEIEGAAA